MKPENLSLTSPFPENGSLPVTASDPCLLHSELDPRTRWVPGGNGIWISTQLHSDALGGFYSAGDFNVLDQSGQSGGKSKAAEWMLRILLDVYTRSVCGESATGEVSLKPITVQRRSGPRSVSTHLIGRLPEEFEQQGAQLWCFLMAVSEEVNPQKRLVSGFHFDTDLLQSASLGEERDCLEHATELFREMKKAASNDPSFLDAVQEASNEIRKRFKKIAARSVLIEVTGHAPVLIEGPQNSSTDPKSRRATRTTVGSIYAFNQSDRTFAIKLPGQGGAVIVGDMRVPEALVGPDGKVDVTTLYSFYLEDEYQDEKLKATYLRGVKPATAEEVEEILGRLLTHGTNDPSPIAA